MSLDERKRKILGAVVRDYVSTVRPIGSEDLASRHAWGVKSATIRNELAELSDLGYLRQPHTSAGRIPSDQGYRFYVDHLMTVRDVAEIGSVKEERGFSSELDTLLRQTCALLTRMTSYTSVATPPRPADTQITQIFLSAMGDGRLLLVVVLSTGRVENRLVPDLPEMSAGDLTTLTKLLNAGYEGKSLDALGEMETLPIPHTGELPPTLRHIYSTLMLVVGQAIQAASDEDSVYLEGASEIIRQPEFRDAEKLESLLETLQRRTLLLHTFSSAFLGPEVAVVIGSENHVTAMRECSVVTAPYFIGTHERGTIGVVGPTRMDYDRAVPAVGFFARGLTHTLSRLMSR
jgi:heat-inducible transcriptional repressor